jgi:hypothetical protein
MAKKEPFGAVQCPDCARIAKQGESSGKRVVQRKAVLGGRSRTLLAWTDCRTCGGLGILDDQPPA